MTDESKQKLVIPASKENTDDYDDEYYGSETASYQELFPDDNPPAQSIISDLFSVQIKNTHSCGAENPHIKD